MEFIKGKYTKSIYKSDNGYIVGLFRVKDASDSLKDMVNKTITITGTVININNDDMYILRGEYINNDRYGYQFRIDEYEKIIPEGIDAISDFLSSPFVKGCGTKTAEKIIKV